MEAIKLTTDWNAEPNSPDVRLFVEGNDVILEFYLNYFAYERFREGEKARLTFPNCHKYSFNTMNDEGYYSGHYRYSDSELPWGGFYNLNSKWQSDFPSPSVTLNSDSSRENLKHYIFFFKDNTFECVAETYELKFLAASDT